MQTFYYKDVRVTSRINNKRKQLGMKNHNGNKLILWLVTLGDFALLNATLLFFIHFFPSLIPPVLDSKTRVFAFIANVAMALAQYNFPSVIHQRHVSFGAIISRIAKLVAVQTALSFVFIRILYNNGGMFRFMFYYAPTLFCIILLARIIERHVLKFYRLHGGNIRSVVFVGSDPANAMIYEELVEDASTGYIVNGYYSNDTIENCPEGLNKLGTLEDLGREMVHWDGNQHIDELFCCLSHDESERIREIMQFCDKNMIRFYYVPRMLGNFSLSLKSERFGSFDLFTNHREPLLDPANRFLKRTFDVTVSATACLVMLPFIPFIALIIKLQSPGPIFFTQARTGLNGKQFKCHKFRSMHVNSDADMQQATLDDPRKFPFGAFMRRTNLDEFPQFFNVLIGDMSIVGPRPHMLYHTEVYSEIIDKYMVRHFSKPGITGWAQVSGYRGETRELWQMEERIKRDIWYIENWSFWLDLKIIWLTTLSLFKPDVKAY